jgi:hypothetical protein
LKQYLKDRLLVASIEAHKKIITEGESVDLASIYYEEGTPLARVHQYNAFAILSKLQFPKDEASDPASDSTKFLDELAAKQLPNEEIIQSLLNFREKVVNS